MDTNGQDRPENFTEQNDQWTGLNNTLQATQGVTDRAYPPIIGYLERGNPSTGPSPSRFGHKEMPAFKMALLLFLMEDLDRSKLRLALGVTAVDNGEL